MTSANAQEQKTYSEGYIITWNDSIKIDSVTVRRLIDINNEIDDSERRLKANLELQRIVKKAIIPEDEDQYQD